MLILPLFFLVWMLNYHLLTQLYRFLLSFYSPSVHPGFSLLFMSFSYIVKTFDLFLWFMDFEGLLITIMLTFEGRMVNILLPYFRI